MSSFFFLGGIAGLRLVCGLLRLSQITSASFQQYQESQTDVKLDSTLNQPSRLTPNLPADYFLGIFDIKNLSVHKKYQYPVQLNGSQFY